MRVQTAEEVQQARHKVISKIRDRAVKALKDGGVHVGQSEVWQMGNVWFVTIEASQPSQFTVSDHVKAEDPATHLSSVVVEGQYDWAADTYHRPYVLAQFKF